MQGYSECKESNIPWLGKVPSHWRLLPCRAIVDNQIEKNEGAEIQEYLSLMANVGVIRYEDKGDVGNKKPDDLAKCKIVKRGNLVINSMNYAIGSYGMSPYDGVCSPVYIVLEPNGNLIERRFALRLFENKPMQKHLALLGNGILEHRAAIKWDDIKPQHVPVPPLEEQKAILDFLDRETARIDNLIAEKQTFIKLLKEKRQALISHVVTKGLDPNVKMKDSGIEWIGEVPEGWVVGRLGFFCESVSTGPFGTALSSSEYIDGGIPVINPSHIHPDGCKPDYKISISDEAAERLKFWRLQTGDVITARRGELGRTAVISDEQNGWICGTGSIRISTKTDKLKAEFLNILFQSFQVRSWLDLNSVGSTMPNLSDSLIKKIPVVIPPSIEEQEILLEQLKLKSVRIEKLIEEVEKSSILLSEQRTALISTAVTGKIDVRNHKEEAA